MKRKYFEEPYSHKSDEETTVNISCRKAMKGYRKVVTRVVVESETANVTKVRVFVKRGRVLYPFWEKDEPEDKLLYWTKRDVVVFAREYILVRFTGAHDEDVFNVTEFGYQEPA